MNEERKSQLVAYIRNQLALAEKTLLEKTFSEKGEKLPHRDIYYSLNHYINEFVNGKRAERWLAAAGLRGVGKTTVVAQLFTNLKVERSRKLYLSLDQTKNLGFSLPELLLAYEEFLGESLETLQAPIFLFLDEVQYEEGWAVTVKTVNDRTRNAFVLATGSSALALQTNADSRRRMILQKVYPLGFAEYLHAKFQKSRPEGLGERIKDALFASETASEVYTKLHQEIGQINSFLVGIERFEIDKYLKYGTLPFALAASSESTIYQQIEDVMDAVIEKDVARLEVFDKQTLPKLPQLLYALSGADIVSVKKLGEAVDLDPRTVAQALDTFEKTEIIIRVMPYGARYSQVKKPSKYLFVSSAYRAMYYSLVGSVEQYENYKGKLLEDIMGMYLHRLFANKLGTVSLTYDNARGGADFILDIKPQKKKIVIEAGMGKKREKGLAQVASTLQKVGGNYGLIVSQTHLSFDEEKNCIFVPLEYFLLI